MGRGWAQEMMSLKEAMTIMKAQAAEMSAAASSAAQLAASERAAAESQMALTTTALTTERELVKSLMVGCLTWLTEKLMFTSWRWPDVAQWELLFSPGGLPASFCSCGPSDPG